MISDCMEWQGSRDKQGYGRLPGGRLAHRASWVAANGPIRDGLCVLHKCDNPPCVNVDHLYLGDRKQNAADMMERGRSLKGRYASHCHKGHPFNEANTYTWSGKANRSRVWHICRACHVEAQHRYLERKRAA